MANIKVTDRSRAVSYQSCPRLRWWNYEYKGHGLQPIYSSLPLVVGSGVHKGIESLLLHVMNGHCQGDCFGSVDFAVEEAFKLYDEECSRRGLALDPSEDSSYVYNEQRALIESLLRGWAIHILPQLLDLYEICEAETEDLFKLDDVECPNCYGAGWSPDESPIACPMCKGAGWNEVWWQSRADILLRERSTGDIYIGSIKNLRQWKQLEEMKSKIDQQGFSELYAVEQRLASEKLELAKSFGSHGTDPYYMSDFVDKVSGVVMLVNVKGSRKKGWSSDEGETGPKVQDSHLVRAWMKQGITSEGDEWAWKSTWTCTEAHKLGNGRKCEGGKNHRLGKEWQRVFIPEFMTIKEWIQMLSSGKVQGEGNPLGEVLLMPTPHLRNASQVKDWLEQITSQELRVAQDAEVVNGLDEGSQEWRSELNRRFPQSTDQCIRYGTDWRCKFYSVCHEGVSEPMDSGLFERRIPHHQLEAAIFAEKGFSV